MKIVKSSILNCKALEHKGTVTCKVFPKKILGYTKSHANIQEFMDCIKDYIKFKDNDENAIFEPGDNIIIKIRI